MTFKEKVQSMSAKEIIETMVEALKNPITKISMVTYGYVENNICYGCAATNTICKIENIDYDSLLLVGGNYSSIITTNRIFLDGFESAIDNLRRGSINDYNEYAEEFNFAVIKVIPQFELPELTSYYTTDQLNTYLEFAKLQE